ncbi:MAG: hypothetical protein PVI01_04600 [Gemmatimonadales bacterium]|jgi:hypothetical protein
MPAGARRLIYGLLVALGFVMMVPLLVQMRRLQAALLADPLAVESALDPAIAGRIQPLMLVFLVGMTVATCFLYASLSVGYPKAWRPRENGAPRCARCDAVLVLGMSRCPACDQHLVW